MSLLGNLFNQSIAIFLSLIAYFVPFQKFLEKLKGKINTNKEKISESLDENHLNKAMKTKDFIQYHKEIHKIDNELSQQEDLVNNLKWAGIVVIAILVIDGVCEFITGFYPFYVLQIQKIVFISFFTFSIIITTLLVQALKLNKSFEDKKPSLKEK